MSHGGLALGRPELQGLEGREEGLEDLVGLLYVEDGQQEGAGVDQRGDGAQQAGLVGAGPAGLVVASGWEGAEDVESGVSFKVQVRHGRPRRQRFSSFAFSMRVPQHTAASDPTLIGANSNPNPKSQPRSVPAAGG